MKNLPEELKKQIPDKPKEDVEEGVKVVDNKINEINSLMNDKMGKLDVLMGMLENKKIDGDVATTVGNVREILKDSIKEQVSEAATEVVNDTIDKAIN